MRVDRRAWFGSFVAFTAMLLCFTSVIPGVASAAINEQISFQGKLTNPDGTNVTNGTFSIRFRIYTDPTLDAANTCVANSCKWEETQGSVSVTDGNFAVNLGSTTAFAGSVDFNASALYLGVKVSTDAEMTPRIRLTAAPYAFNAGQLGGVASTGFVQLGQSASAQSDASTNSSIFINKTAAGNLMQMQSTAVDVFVVTGAGNITLGQNAAHTISVAQESTNAIGNNLTVAAGQGGAGASANAGGQLILQGGAGGGTNGVGGVILLAGGAGSGSGAAGNVVVRNPANSATAFTVQDASSNSIFNVNTTNGQVSVAAPSVPGTDMVSISNAGQGVTTAGVNALGINYVGGNAAVEASGLRIDYAPGGTSGGTWSGLRIVANATGPVSGVTTYGIKLEGPSSPGAGSEVGMQIASGFDIGLDVASGGLQLASTSEPATPAANTLRVYASLSGGRMLLKMKGPSGVSTSLQPALFANKIAWTSAQGNGTTLTTWGLANSATGTATARNVATTNIFTSLRRVGYVSAATAGASAGLRHGVNQYWTGNTAGAGGYYFVARFGIAQSQTNIRSFVGMTATTTALANANPSTLFNEMGFGCDSGDTQFTFMHNDGTGAAVKDALTGAFPCNTTGADMYDARIFVGPNGTTVYYSLENIISGAKYEGSTATDFAANTTLLNPQLWVNNGTTAAAVAMDIISLYMETDN